MVWIHLWNISSINPLLVINDMCSSWQLCGNANCSSALVNIMSPPQLLSSNTLCDLLALILWILLSLSFFPPMIAWDNSCLACHNRLGLGTLPLLLCYFPALQYCYKMIIYTITHMFAWVTHYLHLNTKLIKLSLQECPSYPTCHSEWIIKIIIVLC